MRCFKEVTQPAYTPAESEAESEQPTAASRGVAQTATFSDTHPSFFELQSLLEVITRDYHPFCCGGTCVVPDDAKFHWNFKDEVNQQALTQLISELPVVNTLGESPLASVEDIEVANMLTSISDYTQYMLGQGEAVVLNPAEVRLHSAGGTSTLPVPPKPRAVPGSHLGTVVLILPSLHSEAQLSISWTTGLTHTVDLPATAVAESKIQWAAYHGRCSYQITGLTEGQVVVATYNIVSVPDPSGASHLCLVEDPEMLAGQASFHRGPRAKGIADEVLRKLVARIEAAQAVAGQELGIMLSRKYSVEELGARGGALKGGDRLVWQALKDAGWALGLRPVLHPHALAAAKEKEGGLATGEEEEEVLGVYVVDEEAEEGVRPAGGKPVVSSDGCYLPGLLWAGEGQVAGSCVDKFKYQPVVLVVEAKKR